MSKTETSPVDPIPQSSRRFAFGCIGAIVALLLLLVSIPMTWYMVEQSRGRRELAVEVAKIRQRGLPLTTVELNQQFNEAPGDFDAGAALVAALKVTHDPAVAALAKPLPQVGEGPEPPSLAEDWPDRVAVQEYLAKFQPFLALVELHATKKTKVRYANNLTPGIYTLLHHVQELRNGARVLTLQFHVDLRNGSIEAAIQRLDQTVFLAETLREEPFLVAQLVRIAITGVALHNLEYLLANVTLTDAQLAQLQQTFRQVDMQHSFATGLKGELATGYTATTWPLAHLADGSGKQIPDDEVMRLAKRGPNRPGDAALMLKFYGRLLEANDESLAAAAAETNAINDEIKQLAGSHRKIFYMHTLLLFPAVQAATNAHLRTDARCKSADAALAALRYRQAKGSWPTVLADLVPAYLPAVPTDPYNGKPMLFKTTDQELTVYAVGENKVDDGGTWTDAKFPDVGFVAPWREEKK